MLKYETIYQVRDARERLKRNSYRHTTHFTRDSDTMLVFTIGSKADAEAQNNLDFCLDVGRRFDAQYLVLHENKIQFVGAQIKSHIMKELAPDAWRKEYMAWSDSRNIDFMDDGSGLGEFYSFRPLRRAFADKNTQGIYDIATGQRIKNRREIITRFWDLGFAAQRGQPLSVCPIRWSGRRDELEDLTEIADRHWRRKNTSEVAKKIVSSFRSINRFAAWPGAW